MATTKRTIRTAILAATLGLGAAGAATAGSCPADKVVPDGKGQPNSGLPASGVVDTVIATNDVAKAPFNIKDRIMRMRLLTIAPGGVVPWHSHGDRPAIIYIVSGEIVEYASTCAVPIVHKPGEAAPETFPTQHWWKNLGPVPVVLISADLFHKDDKNGHMM